MTDVQTESQAPAGLTRGDRLWWILTLLALAGPLVFGLGYANFGIRVAGLPLPIADILLAVLLARVLAPVITRRAPLPDLPMLCALALAAIGLVRLAIDHGTYGTFAARDAVLPLELTFLLVGAWSMGRFGLERWSQALTWIFLAALAYFLVLEFSNLERTGPLVGFTQDRRLLDPSWAEETASGAGLFFFLWMRPFGRWSYAISAVFFANAFLSEKRGIYVGLTLAVVVTVIIAWRGLDRAARRNLLVAGGACAVALVLLLTFAPTGRHGPLTPSLVVDQLRTLVGLEGEGGGTISDRAEWAQGVIEQMNERPSSYLVGLGLGPDLLQGFVDLNDLPVRKPHNDYLEVMARLGIPALLLMVGALFVPLVIVGRGARRRDGPERDYLLFVVGASIVILFIAATQPLLWYPFGTVPLGFYLGSGYAIARDRERDRSD